MNFLGDSLQPPVIKVFGIGHCGINVVNRMIENGIQGADFIAIACDTQELARSKTDHRLHLASAKSVPPGIGISALMLTISEDDRAHIRSLISEADIVFIVAGMGGGTGTSIAPIVAKISRNMQILNIAVVSMPLPFEGNRPHRAGLGINELRDHTDSLVIVPNSMLMTGGDIKVSEVFSSANNLMSLAVTGIAEAVSDKNFIYIDITELRMIFADAGMVTMGTAIASGKDRAKAACEQALANLFPATINLIDTRCVLINITSTSSLKLSEVANVIGYWQFAATKAMVVAVAIVDETMEDDLRLTLFATTPRVLSSEVVAV